VQQSFGIEAKAVRELGLRDANDQVIFLAARQAAAVVMTKDRDFVDLVNRMGTPPQAIWLTCGNTTNGRLRQVLAKTFVQALILLTAGKAVIEIKDS